VIVRSGESVEGVIEDGHDGLERFDGAAWAAWQVDHEGPSEDADDVVQEAFLKLVEQKPAPDQPPNSVLQVLEQGFMIHDRVLRPAKVIVSAPA
jgi:hypothetical protein